MIVAHCNDECTRCIAIRNHGTANADTIECDPYITYTGYLDGYAFAKCRRDTMPPGGYVFRDTGRISLEFVRFLKNTGTKYGFDDWKDKGKNYRDNITYISLAIGDSTSFKIDLRYNYLFPKYLAIIKGNRNVFFDKACTTTVKEIKEGANDLTIYTPSTISEGTANIGVIGISKGGDTSCIA
jgi:hypothetical protein